MTNHNIIIFSSIDWSTHWQIHHQLTTSLINSGHRVLFIENTGVRSPSIKDFGRIRNRIKSRINSTHGFRELNNSTTIYSPIFIPYPYNYFAVLFNILIISKSINNWIKRANFIDPIVISFLPTPSIRGIIQEISPLLSIYYCADDMTGTLAKPSKLIKSESSMFQNSDLILTTSHKIYDRAKLFSKLVHFIPAGVDIDKFVFNSLSRSLPNDIKSLKQPIIGYIGAIRDIIDKELIVELANSLPHATILLVGPKHTNTEILEGCKNIVLLAERPHDQISSYIQSFDVALIPYIVNEFTNSIYPFKLNEYLAMGIPVVTTNMLEVRLFEEEYPGSVMVGQSVKDFINKVNNILNNPKAKSQIECEKRINIAKDNTWDMRYTAIFNEIEKSIEIKSKKKIDWQKNIVQFYKKRRIRWLSRLLIFFGLYFFVFYSPLAWYMGEQLIIRDVTKQADAVVVFSGHNELSYRNTSYQRRALDAARLYREGHIKNIYLSTGVIQSVSEVEFIRLFLISKGIPDTNIHVLEKYPTSTYENVVLVKQMLEGDNVDSILFITDPYHSMRATLIWKKNAPNIKILSPEVIDTPSKKIKWGMGLDKTRDIFYEYLAIVHNWLKGRL